MNKLKSIAIIFLFSGVIFTQSSCGIIFSSKSMKGQIEDPLIRTEIERSLKTEEDWAYWIEIKEYNDNEFILLP